MEKKFAIVSTWNGEGYSMENALEEIFEGTFEEAKAITALFMNQNNVDGITVEITDNGYRFSYDEEDFGTFQALELKDDSYGIVIDCMVNEAEVLNQLDFCKRLEEAMLNSDPELMDDDDFEGFTVFVPSLDGNDLQFIEL